MSMEDRLTDIVVELQCNLDDMTPEDIGFAMEQLLEAGALDVYTSAIQMKKNRPAVLFTCLCNPEDREQMAALIFRHTTTLGVRETVHKRYILSRETETRSTPFGAVRVKCASGWGVSREKPEYDDLKKIAAEQDVSISALRKLL